MATYYAHSEKDGHVAQFYVEHIQGVWRRAVSYADDVERYAIKSNGTLQAAVNNSALWHDLGKLHEKNQAVICGKAKSGRHLPVNHVDAGCAALIQFRESLSVLAVYAHHVGLPNMAEERIRGKAIFRDNRPAIRQETDALLADLIQKHCEVMPEIDLKKTEKYSGDQTVFLRMLLSCLADADHTDTSVNYGHDEADDTAVTLRAEERLVALDQYVAGLGNANDARSRLRRNMYISCRNAKSKGGFTTCDSPVGSGKTTAVMAHLLQQAISRQARRIFVVLPYTSIIKQSVDIYRKALVLTGENPEAVVAELHCRADFEDESTRYLTALWRAPIVVTTAVAFFETLASNKPATLRRLHELPGSVIFVDESHNALPTDLLPLAWRWMNVLADEWSCYWVLASGSLVRFWQLDAFKSLSLSQPQVNELVAKNVRTQLMDYEKNRVNYGWESAPLTKEELIEWVHHQPGPRLLIVNTVQTAAVIANDFSKKYGRQSVEHLSSGLTPEDRDAAINKIQKRLKDSDDSNWTLVATSCVEAGVDFSFRTGFRECSSLLSLLQAAGRVNRHGVYHNATIWSFVLRDHSSLKQNPQLRSSREVLKGYFNRNIVIAPELSTKSMNDELIRNDAGLEKISKLLARDKTGQFRDIEQSFEVIDSNTVTVVIDSEFTKQVSEGCGDWQQMQRKSIAIRREYVNKWNLQEIASGIYRWTLPYDSFLGYMRGVLE